MFIPCSSQGVRVSHSSGVFSVHINIFYKLNVFDRSGMHWDLQNLPRAVYPGVSQHFHPHPYLEHPRAPWGSQDQGLRWISGFDQQFLEESSQDITKGPAELGLSSQTLLPQPRAGILAVPAPETRRIGNLQGFGFLGCREASSGSVCVSTGMCRDG